jgi:hypothetical protein
MDGRLSYQNRQELDYLTVALHEEWTFSDIKSLGRMILWRWVME